MAWLFVLLYIKFLGIKAYGLVGFFATLQRLFIILDMGLSTTLNRELVDYPFRMAKSKKNTDVAPT